ncbi:MAG: hypothetical protein WCI54_10600, partial [Bacteroidia bacterium]
MKKQIILLMFVFFALCSFGQITLPLLEEFDAAPVGKQFGVFAFNNYGSPDVANANYTAYTFEQDATGKLSGPNSAKMNITATGNQWWTIQVRLENLTIAAGDSVEISFIAQSTADMTFVAVLEASDGTHDPFNKPVTLLAGQRTVVSYRTPAVAVLSKNNLILGLGNSTAVACELWVDSVSIKVPGI